MEDAVRDGGAGEAGDVLDAGVGPVVDYEEGEEGGAEGVEPPEGEKVAEQGEEEGEGVEDDIRFAVCIKQIFLRQWRSGREKRMGFRTVWWKGE